MPSLILLTGFSGTGKTAVGRRVAHLLEWDFLDTDQEIERRAGKPIERIFGAEGEAAFRRLEAHVLVEACTRTRAVIATGGGTMADERNRELMLRSGLVVCLDAHPEAIHARLFHGRRSQKHTVRPLLQGVDPLDNIRQLKAQRQSAYDLAHHTVHTDEMTVLEAAQEVIHLWQRFRHRAAVAAEADPPEQDLAAIVHSSVGECPIYVGWDILKTLGRRCHEAGLKTTAYLISDSNVAHLHGRVAQVSLEEAGIPTHLFIIAAGEQSKTLETAGLIYGWLAERLAQRGHFVVALGGGVVGDLAGFVAATYARGMPVVQVPTSLAAMVDAAVGGKTAVNLPQGKNLVGAFHQPRFVLADVASLATLPPRELTSGWAEAIKHGLILDGQLFRTFEEHAQAIATLEQEIATQVVRRSVAIKAAVVSQDEKETKGIRTLLNYGHTVGHALEAATEYGRLLHGEAVAIGMTAAARISQRLGMLDEDEVQRQTRLLERFGLPTRFPGADLAAVQRAMQVDKKSEGKAIRWVLLEAIGRAVTRTDVPPHVVEEMLRDALAPS